MGERFDVLKAEFKKVIWPDQRTAAKETAAVVFTGVALGVLLSILDNIIKFGLSFIM